MTGITPVSFRLYADDFDCFARELGALQCMLELRDILAIMVRAEPIEQIEDRGDGGFASEHWVSILLWRGPCSIDVTAARRRFSAVH